MKYRIIIYGFDPVEVDAPTRGAAKWACYRNAREAGYFREGFHAFLVNLSRIVRI